MTHAEERVQERLTKAGWNSNDQTTLFQVVNLYASRTSGSTAARVAVLPDQVGKAWGEDSNGNEVWAIYRNQSLVTVMLRRSSQPDSGLRCDTVERLV